MLTTLGEDTSQRMTRILGSRAPGSRNPHRNSRCRPLLRSLPQCQRSPRTRGRRPGSLACVLRADDTQAINVTLIDERYGAECRASIVDL